MGASLWMACSWYCAQLHQFKQRLQYYPGFDQRLQCYTTFAIPSGMCTDAHSHPGTGNHLGTHRKGVFE